MSELCRSLNCHNLGSSNYQGYCNEDHQKRGPETDFLLKIISSHPGISTLKEARKHTSKDGSLTSSFRCEVCKELLRGSNAYPRE
jgi:hypothetical protein